MHLFKGHYLAKYGIYPLTTTAISFKTALFKPPQNTKAGDEMVDRPKT